MITQLESIIMQIAIAVLTAVLCYGGSSNGCPYGEWRCLDDSICIPDFWRCDGVKDCGDASDERNCVCPSSKFDCGNGQCIRIAWVCDGEADCTNGLDERNCSTPITKAPLGSAAPDFVVGAGCGVRRFEHVLTRQQNRPKQLAEKEGAPFIVGGIEAVRGSLPWQVSVQTLDGFHFCGGTIIDRRWILCAAHCFVDGVDDTVIAAGEHELGTTEGSEQTRLVQRVFLHPDFDPITFHDDIALIQVARELHYDDYVQPACLPALENEAVDYAEGLWLIISGWGSTFPALCSPKELQVATVPMISEEHCEKAYPIAITDSMFCAGKLGIGGTDTCQGDSGGPVVRKVGDKFTVLGIVSWGIGCARPPKPGVYTRTARFEDWIKGTIYNHQ